MAIGKRGARELVRIADALHIPSDTYKFLPTMSVASRTAAALSQTIVQYKREQNKKEKKTRPHSTVSDNPHTSARRLVTKAKKKCCSLEQRGVPYQPTNRNNERRLYHRFGCLRAQSYVADSSCYTQQTNKQEEHNNNKKRGSCANSGLLYT